MLNWLKDKKITAIESKISLIEARIQAIEIRFEALVTTMNSVRGLVNRKVRKSGRFNDPDDEDEDAITEEERKFIAEYQSFQAGNNRKVDIA